MAQDDYIRTALRVPPELHQALHEAADRTSKSFNAEINERLQRTFDDERLAAQRLAAEAGLMGLQAMLAIHLKEFFELLPVEEQGKPVNKAVRDVAQAISQSSAKEIEDALSHYVRMEDEEPISRMASAIARHRVGSREQGEPMVDGSGVKRVKRNTKS